MAISKHLGIRRITKLINCFDLSIPEVSYYPKQAFYKWNDDKIEVEIFQNKTYVYLYDESTLWKFKTHKIKNNEFYKVFQLIHEYLSKYERI